MLRNPIAKQNEMQKVLANRLPEPSCFEWWLVCQVCETGLEPVTSVREVLYPTELFAPD
jgi:hypothetical protein